MISTQQLTDRFRQALTEKWGYIDQSGQWAIPPVDGYCREFRDGLARINLYPDVLFVDQEGNELYRYSY